jgi:hypothetical protein
VGGIVRQTSPDARRCRGSAIRFWRNQPVATARA